MSKIWYLSPSNQSANVGVLDYGTEKEQMNLLVAEIVPHLDRAGVSFHVGDPDMSIQERAAESNDMQARFHLALHSNAGGKGNARGPVAYYYSDAGKAFGEMVVAELLALGQENNRAENVKQETGFYELRKTRAPACLLEVDFHDSEAGVRFLTRRRAEIAEAIARVIIASEGKEFVPVTPGEYRDRAVSWDLFDPHRAGFRWSDPMTREEAAILAVRLVERMEKGVK